MPHYKDKLSKHTWLFYLERTTQHPYCSAWAQLCNPQAFFLPTVYEVQPQTMMFQQQNCCPYHDSLHLPPQ